MKLTKTLMAFLLVLTMSACGGLTREDTNAWLDTKIGPANINLTGEWDTGGVWTGGWGKGSFIQEGRKFSGTLGLYFAEGTVSDDEIYMVIFSGKKIYYTALLKKVDSETYMGRAVEKAIVDSLDSRNANTYVLKMKRISK